MTLSEIAPAPSDVGSVALTRSQVVAWRNAIFVIFALSGIALASWVARTPSIRDVLGASTFQMGMLVFGLALGSIVGLTSSSHLLARIGSAATIRLSLVAVALGLVITGIGATMASFAIVVMGLALFGLGFRRPFLLVLVYVYIDIVAPQRLTYYLLNAIQISLVAVALAVGGWLLLEHGWDQAAGVRELLNNAGFQDVASRKDLAGHDRCSGGLWPGRLGRRTP